MLLNYPTTRIPGVSDKKSKTVITKYIMNIYPSRRSH